MNEIVSLDDLALEMSRVNALSGSHERDSRESFDDVSISGSIDGIILLVGTSDGRLSLLSESSALLFAHRFVHSPITAMRTTNENGESTHSNWKTFVDLLLISQRMPRKGET